MKKTVARFEILRTIRRSVDNASAAFEAMVQQEKVAEEAATIFAL